uniref:CSON002926 protein n=1 Tax=Culicoides sonorensis TaxID=179676 RepID=A0A336JYP0_CULSO
MVKYQSHGVNNSFKIRVKEQTWKQWHHNREFASKTKKQLKLLPYVAMYQNHQRKKKKNTLSDHGFWHYSFLLCVAQLYFKSFNP